MAAGRRTSGGVHDLVPGGGSTPDGEGPNRDSGRIVSEVRRSPGEPAMTLLRSSPSDPFRGSGRGGPQKMPGGKDPVGEGMKMSKSARSIRRVHLLRGVRRYCAAVFRSTGRTGRVYDPDGATRRRSERSTMRGLHLLGREMTSFPPERGPPFRPDLSFRSSSPCRLRGEKSRPPERRWSPRAEVRLAPDGEPEHDLSRRTSSGTRS